MREILYREGKYTIERVSEFSDELVALLDGVQWGSEGARYVHKRTMDQLRRIEEPILVELCRHRKMIGMCVFIRRKIFAGKDSIWGYYIRYLYGIPEVRGRGIMVKYAAKTMEVMRSLEQESAVYIGIVEAGNRGSYRLVNSVKMPPVGKIRTIPFSRFFPRRHKDMKVYEDNLPEEHLEKIREFYRDYSFWHTENILESWQYFTLEHNGEMIAGVQAAKGHWVINNLPGWTGRVLMKVMPSLPFLRKVFNPSNFEFVAFDYIYYKEGRLKDLERLFSSVLRHFRLKTALFWFDAESPHADEITDAMRMGPVYQFGAGNDSYIMAGFENTPEHVREKFKNMPSFQSSGDFI